jgi:hypothetical protein
MKRHLLFLLLLFSYSVVYAQIPVYSGKSEGHDTASFIVVGDLQLRGPTEFGREDNRNAVGVLLNKIANENPVFILILGDLTWDGGVHELWNSLDSLAAPILNKHIPVYPLPGNHEYFGEENPSFADRLERGYKTNTDWYQEYFSRFPNVNEELWYSKKWKDIGIIMLNSNFRYLSNDEIKQQLRWYSRELKKMQADSLVTTIIVACHQAPYTNGSGIGFPDSDDENAKKYFVKPYLMTPKAKLFLAGHCHSYEHLKINGKDFIVSGGGGPRRKVKLQPTDSVMYDLSNLPELRQHHFCKFIRESDGLHMQMIQVADDLNTWTIGEEITVK